jgi:putative phosphoribosyl transferase
MVMVGARRLPGTLGMPAGQACGMVIFAHGSGSSRFSPRNRLVAERLQKAEFATLLIDLLSEDEARDRNKVFDIPLLAGRLADAIAWSGAQPDLSSLPCGLFGASTGAAAALLAAAEHPEELGAVVSRGGRPDLAEPVLPLVKAATLLIVGGADTEVLSLNRAALALMHCEKRLDVVAGATHLFAEPGALEQVAERAAGWFGVHLKERRIAARS